MNVYCFCGFRVMSSLGIISTVEWFARVGLACSESSRLACGTKRNIALSSFRSRDWHSDGPCSACSASPESPDGRPRCQARAADCCTCGASAKCMNWGGWTSGEGKEVRWCKQTFPDGRGSCVLAGRRLKDGGQQPNRSCL
jgi:hypothetical protein